MHLDDLLDKWAEHLTTKLIGMVEEKLSKRLNAALSTTPDATPATDRTPTQAMRDELAIAVKEKTAPDPLTAAKGDRITFAANPSRTVSKKMVGQLLVCLRKYPGLKGSELQEQLSTTTWIVHRHINHLIKLGKLKTEGKTNQTRYYLSDGV